MRDSITGALISLPAAAGLLLFFVVPACILLPASLCEFDVRMRPTYVGLANYHAIAASPQVRRVITTTATMSVVTLASTMTTALIGAFALEGMRRGAKLRAAFQILGMLGQAANSVFWVWLFAPVWGGLAKIFPSLGLPVISWHSDGRWAFVACCIVLWQWLFPSKLYFMSVAVSAVSREILEAAMLDGATAWQRFRYVTLPMIHRPLAYLAVTSVAGLAQVYQVPLLLFNGGPLGATETIMMSVAGFEGGYGQAAALTLLFVVAVTVPCAVAWKVGRG